MLMSFPAKLLAFLLICATLCANSSLADDQPPAQRPIKIAFPKTLAADELSASRTPLGLPNDYKPWIVQLKSGELLIVAFCYGGTPSNELPAGEPYRERAVFWRSQDGGQSWGPREERSDIQGREFAMTRLADGTLIMPCQFLANDAANKAGYAYSKIFRSADEGRTWSEQRVGPEGFPDKAETSTDWTAVELPDPQRADKSIVQLGVAMQHGGPLAPGHVFLWRSRDSGATWDKSLVADTQGWIDVDGFFSQSTTYRSRSGTLWHPVRVDATGPHWKLPAPGFETRSGDQDDRTMLWKSADGGLSWRRHADGGRFGTYGEMYPRFLPLADRRLLLTFTVRSNSNDGYPLGLRALISPDGGETWDFAHDRIVLSDRNRGASGGGFGNTIQLRDQTLVSVYSYRGEDGKTHVEAVRWKLPKANADP
ncbi:MAG TPA: sialidase family protein [Pirellulales bacterium]|nr:sialidase family protein [Pirellulales bacterium]